MRTTINEQKQQAIEMSVQLSTLWSQLRTSTRKTRFDTVNIATIRKIKKQYGNVRETRDIKQECITHNPQALISKLNARLDSVLVNSNWTTSIIEAKGWIKRGLITINDKVVTSCNYKPKELDCISITDTNSEFAQIIRMRLSNTKSEWSWMHKE